MSNVFTNVFAGGRIVNCKGNRTYAFDNIEEGKTIEVTFKIDKNLSIYDVNPRIINILGESHDALSVVRGQTPDAGANTLYNIINKWWEEAKRYNQ